ncbi:MAG: carboxypeptidase-like regulatory domain-containing protein [Puia sp.]
MFIVCIFPSLLFAQEKINVSGAVYSETGEPLSGVTVSAKNTAGSFSTSSLSNDKGSFN